MARKFNRKRRPPKLPRSTPDGEHRSVLRDEVLKVLDPKPGMVIVDATLGFAGHAFAVLERLGQTGLLIATDLDTGSIPKATETLESLRYPFQVFHANFAGLPGVLAQAGVTQVDAVLADLGMSSMQVDDPARGFSYMRDGPLDMRMDCSRGRTAAEFVNESTFDELVGAFTEFGDEPNAATIAAAIVLERNERPFETTKQLRATIDAAAPVQLRLGPGYPPVHKQKLLPATRVFQALRIAVNRELANLTQLLRILPSILKPGGTAAIISFHSGEDRLVKTTFRDARRMGVYAAASGDPIRPSEEEKLANPRSRSAKLRWARLPRIDEIVAIPEIVD